MANKADVRSYLKSLPMSERAEAASAISYGVVPSQAKVVRDEEYHPKAKKLNRLMKD